MKYLPLPEMDIVHNALNFCTADCFVIGGCDIFTTKAAGSDKKLYKNIEQSLESQYESLVRMSASLSPPAERRATPANSDDGNEGSQRKKRSRTIEAPGIDLSRPSPFGPLSQIRSRRTFAYLIATLNASHPDYDFSYLLKPSDFRREWSLKSIIHHIDSTIQHLRPNRPFYDSSLLFPTSGPAVFGSNSDSWGPRMWSLIDQQMMLRKCERYSYCPDEDPFDGGDGGGALWSMHYFFYNKDLKRVCYFHLRGLSVVSHSPVYRTPSYSRKRRQSSELGAHNLSVRLGAGKRASYWLGSKA
ncbi:hypothetical protein M433DRAFT_43999, partial [Acidomyces richmondensis BFW]